MSDVICPYCFDKFDKKDVWYRCGNVGRCQERNDDTLAAFWNEGVQMTGVAIEPKKGFLSGMFGSKDSAKCPECGAKTFLMICPTCHNRLPGDMVRRGGKIISIIGARSSGKTNYITTLINELIVKGDRLGNMGITAVNVTDDPRYNTQRRYEEDFFNILYRKGECPPQTQPNDPRNKVPLIYEVSSPQNDPLYLVFYDTAGENFADPKNIAGNVRFLEESDAVIFLLDTLAINHVHDTLNLPGDIELEYNKIVSNLKSHFTQGNIPPAKQKAFFSKPMALAFSKIDAILNNSEKFEDTQLAGISIENNSNYLDGSPVSLADFNSISISIEEALKSWSEANFVNVMKNNFTNYKYFGISALGAAPDDNNNIKRIRPYRVLDPLVWILHEIGYKLPVNK